MKVLQRIKQFSFVIGIGLALLSLFFLYTGDSVLRNPERIIFQTENDDTLIGFYHLPQDASNYGVLMLEGFGSDQVSLRSAANEFLREGVQVFTFDFFGHGRSEGTLMLDNASTDLQSKQVLDALLAFQEVSGLELNQIFLFGHSLGARVAVQATVMNELDVAGLILLGPQINLLPNTQSEFFTGTSDVDIAWVSKLGPNQPEVPILILSGSWEDILPVDAAVALQTQLSGVSVVESGVEYGDEKATREWKLFPAVFHNFEIYSPKMLNYSVDWVGERTEAKFEHTHTLNPSARKIIFWFSAMLGILIFLSSARQYVNERGIIPVDIPLTIEKRNRFLAAKFWLWFPAILVGAVVLAPFFFLPIGLPLFNIYYVVFIGGYGVLNLLLYLSGKMPGVSGKLSLVKEIRLSENIDWRYVFGLNVLLIVFLILFARSGWFWIPPTGDRFTWLLIFTPFTVAGFWSGAFDQKVLDEDDRKGRHLVQLNGFLPFILYAILMVVIGSWSGVINGLIGLLILWIIFQQGKITAHLTGSRWFSALLQAIMLYLIILPQGVLFSF